MEMQGSLSGVKVLDLSRLLPGPYCSMLLADHGAEVISIEDRRFESDNLFFTSLYRNKKHLSLNLKSAEGKEIFAQLAARSDILIEGFRPGVAARLGLDYDTIHQQFPAIIYCSISGYGQTGPWADRAGHDINYLGTSGVLDLIGPAAGPPSIPGIQIGDISGSLNAVIGILLALVARNRSGMGQYVDISMTDSLLGFLSLPHHFYTQTQRPPKRSAELLSHRYACYNTYETADGAAMAVGALEHRFWKQLCRALDIEHYADLQFDETRRAEIIAELGAIFRTRSSTEWEQHLQDLDVCCTRVLKFDEVLDHPLFRDRQMITELEQPDGSRVKSLGLAIKLSETPGAIGSGPVEFGQHNEEILGGLGYSEAEISQLKLRKVI